MSGTNVLRQLMFLFMVVLCTSSAMAQKKVTGTIVDAAGEPIIGASVMVKGTSNGAVTDLDGNFTINNVPEDATLVFSYVGYRTQNLSARGKSNFQISLEEDKQLLDEVVVVGYGVQRKSDVTGALTRVNEEQLNNRPVSNAIEALQGKAAGVDITTSERPGTLGSIRIRGNRSINASNEPLYVVDGVPLSSGGIESLNSRDIESIDILKDASSTAIYGSRGANGVVLITTKRGKEGKLQLTYNGSVTFEKIVDKSPAMNASDYITWRRWAYYNSSSASTAYPRGDQPTLENDRKIFTGDDVAWKNIEKGWEGGSWDGSKVTDTDWTDLVTQTGITHEHTLRAQGGTKDIQASFSFGYLNNEGTQKGQEYERYNAAVTADVQATKWFKMGGSINASWSKQDYGFSRTGQSSSSGPTDIYGAAKAILRYTLPYDENGQIINMPGGSTTNTYTVIDEWTKSNDNREVFRALGSFYGQIDFGKIFEPVQGLMYKMQFGPDFRYSRQGIYLDATSATRLGGKNYVRRGDDRHFSWTLDNMLIYNRTFGDHAIGLTLLHSASKYNAESSSINEEGNPFPSFLWNNMGTGIDITEPNYKVGLGTGLTENSLQSWMARVNYSFMDRYLLTASVRRDGSSVLSEGNKWDTFPSLAIGWRMEQEKWLRDVNWIDQLKLRFGIGVTGNSSVGPYGTLGVISGYWMPFSTGNSFILVTNEPYYSSGSNKLPNKNLGWEKTTQYNFGVDFSFLRGRINGAFDIYTSRTKDLLLAMSLPSLTGYPSMMDNIGETKNKGFDLTLNFIPVQTNGFEWISTLNAAWQKDEIVELANGNEGGWNTQLDSLFAELDLQQRHVIHPWQDWNGVDAHHYPGYYTSTGRMMNGYKVFMPTEFLHAQYDRGAGAGLEDYWQQWTAAPNFAGGFIWSFSDEAVLRTDSLKLTKRRVLDSDGPNGPDGVVGPHREREGSFYTIRDVWSPVQISPLRITPSFDGKLLVSNHFLFSRLSECTARYQVYKDTVLLDEGKVSLPDIAPGERAAAHFPLPARFFEADILKVEVFGADGACLSTWTWPIPTAHQYFVSHQQSPSSGTAAVEGNTLSAKDNTVEFEQGAVKAVRKNGTLIPFTGGVPVGVKATFRSSYTHMDGTDALLVAKYEGGLDSIVWRMTPEGRLGMHAVMVNRKGDFYDRQIHFLGLSFNYPESEAKGIRWMGRGPYRVWKNRLRGQQFGIWQKDYNNTVTGEQYDHLVYPEFKGYHANLYWATLQSDTAPFTVYGETDGLYLRLFTPEEPVQRRDGKNTMPAFPEGDISFLFDIPGIQSFRSISEQGPRSQPSSIRLNAGDEGLHLRLWFQF